MRSDRPSTPRAPALPAALLGLALLFGCAGLPPDAPNGIWTKVGITRTDAERDRQECSHQAEEAVLSRWAALQEAAPGGGVPLLDSVHAEILSAYSACLRARGYSWGPRLD